MDRVQLRLQGISQAEWREALAASLRRCHLTSAVELIKPAENRFHEGAAVVDPAIVVALISGGASIIAALIPVLVDVFRTKTEKPDATVSVVIRGTRESVLIETLEPQVSVETIEKTIASVGQITEIAVTT